MTLACPVDACQHSQTRISCLKVRALKSSRVALEGRLEKARAEELSTRAAADALRADLDASRAAHQRANAVPVHTLSPVTTSCSPVLHSRQSGCPAAPPASAPVRCWCIPFRVS